MPTETNNFGNVELSLYQTRTFIWESWFPNEF